METLAFAVGGKIQSARLSSIGPVLRSAGAMQIADRMRLHEPPEAAVLLNLRKGIGTVTNARSMFLALGLAAAIAAPISFAATANADVGVGVHVGGVGAGVNVGIRDGHRHRHCSNWAWRHHRRYCHRWSW